MRRIWTVISSASVLVAMGLVVCLAPTSFVLRSPGTALDLLSPENPLIRVDGQTTATTGSVLATSMVQTAPTGVATLPGVIVNYLRGDRDALPRDAVYPPGQTANDAASAHDQLVESSREQAVVAGARQAGVDVVERVRIASVWQKGQSYQVLFPGDYVLEIDNTPMSTVNDVTDYIQNNKQVGDQVVVTVLRGETTQKFTIKLAGSSTNGTVPSLGIVCDMGYWYTPRVDIVMGVDQGDPAQGLALALATYDLLTPSALPGDAVIAAVGQITADGIVSKVSAINEQATSAWDAHATTLLIPRDNCADVTGDFPGMAIVPVLTLDQAVAVLSSPATDGSLPHC